MIHSKFLFSSPFSPPITSLLPSFHGEGGGIAGGALWRVLAVTSKTKRAARGTPATPQKQKRGTDHHTAPATGGRRRTKRRCCSFTTAPSDDDEKQSKTAVSGGTTLSAQLHSNRHQHKQTRDQEEQKKGEERNANKSSKARMRRRKAGRALTSTGTTASKVSTSTTQCIAMPAQPAALPCCVSTSVCTARTLPATRASTAGRRTHAAAGSSVDNIARAAVRAASCVFRDGYCSTTISELITGTTLSCFCCLVALTVTAWSRTTMMLPGICTCGHANMKNELQNDNAWAKEQTTRGESVPLHLSVTGSAAGSARARTRTREDAASKPPSAPTARTRRAGAADATGGSAARRVSPS